MACAAISTVRVPLEPRRHTATAATPCSASARASTRRLPRYRRTTRLTLAPGAATARPPMASIGAGFQSLTALETYFPKSKSSRTSPGTVRKPRLERSRTINIWCDRKQRDMREPRFGTAWGLLRSIPVVVHAARIPLAPCRWSPGGCGQGA